MVGERLLKNRRMASKILLDIHKNKTARFKDEDEITEKEDRAFKGVFITVFAIGMVIDSKDLYEFATSVRCEQLSTIYIQAAANPASCNIQVGEGVRDKSLVFRQA